ncbi:baseplate protein [Pseudomonas sp. BR1R-5]|uniref:baseplate assembly protein n=1 Tax=Pseudomonas sp. BR1R-5 TaxID=3003626 RepID=UPI0022CAE427|nr:baseplate J/gp47 family protein [Pseudomonas sp. BR1R-5]GLH33988.1 baseplate protein [Pseudomonas sp. BR1R-5]
MRELSKPVFVTIDPAATEADLIARYEASSGKTLYPAQIERLFIDLIAYTRSRVDMAIQNAGEQLLVRFANGVILDYLGELVATPRLLATSARCQIRFSLPAVSTQPVYIAAGTRVSTQDGKLTFTTDQAVTIAAGQLQVDVAATCLTAGTQGNDWALGQISVISNTPVAALVASNITVTSEGAEDEEDDRYRERIILAPEAFSNAGSRGAYRYHALAVHQSIIDVAVHGPDEGQQDGHVALYPLTSTGLPSADLLEQVKSTVSGEKVRPLCDTVHALMPVEVPYTIRAQLTFYDTAEQSEVLAAAVSAATAYAADRRSKLGLDLVPEQLTAALQVEGIYRAVLEFPGALRELQGNEWANCTGIELVPAGVAYG